MAQKSRPTINDVARASGVSISTVSLVLNHKGSISERTRRHVTEVAKDLGYSANPMARALSGSQSKFIGLSIRSFDVTGMYALPGVDYYSVLLNALWTRALEAGYGVVLVGRDHTRSDNLLPTWVDGFIVEDPLPHDTLIEQLQAHNVPLVTIGKPPGAHTEIPWVATDDEQESHKALQHLHEQGAQKITLVSGQERAGWHLSGEKEYKNYMKTIGEKPIIVRIPEGDGVEGGHKIGLELLGQEEIPDAIFCHTGRHATGILRATKELGIEVPQRLLIAASVDSVSARQIEPSITAIDVRPEELGQSAVELLVRMLQNQSYEKENIVDGVLRIRGTTSALPEINS